MALDSAAEALMQLKFVQLPTKVEPTTLGELAVEAIPTAAEV